MQSFLDHRRAGGEIKGVHSAQSLTAVPPEVANHWENWASNEGVAEGNSGVRTPAASTPSGPHWTSIVSQEDQEELLENSELIDIWKAEFQARHQTYPEYGTIGT
jgi:hypothetical protein